MPDKETLEGRCVPGLTLVFLKGLSSDQVVALRKRMPMSAFVGSHRSGAGRFRDVYDEEAMEEVRNVLQELGIPPLPERPPE